MTRLMRSLRGLVAVASKETREIWRDPMTLGIAVILPLVMMFLFSYAISLDVKDISLAVVDEDHSPESRAYVASILRSGYFRLHAAPQDLRTVTNVLDRGAARVAVVIPADFSRTLGQGVPAEVQLLLDGSFPNTALVALNYLEAITQAYEARLQERTLAARLGRLPSISAAIRVEPRVRYNPALRSEYFVVPGLFAVILMAFPPLLTALAVVRERERGSIQQIYTSPIRIWPFFVGKLLPYAVIAFVDMLILLGAARLWFRIAVRGSVSLLLALALLYVFATVGIGLVVSTWTRSQVVALLLAIVLTLMPALLFSGFLFPIAGMPPVFQVYTYLFPARYFMEVSRGIVLKGLGIADLWHHAVLLLVYTLGLFGLAALRFRKKIG
jgi:ABC-2 type transport system permease protein